MEKITTIGLDITKSVFQVHAISATGTVVLRRQFGYLVSITHLK